MTGQDQTGDENLKKEADTLTVITKATCEDNDDVDYTDYRFEIARLNSFVDWPKHSVDPKKLAAAGFFYTKRGDVVKCFACLIDMAEWEEGDDPMKDHQRWSGNCPFVRGTSCGNVPIGLENSSSIPKRPKRMDTCGVYGVKYMPCSGPDDDLQTEKAINSVLVHPEVNDDIEIAVFWDSNTNANFKAKVGDVLGSKEPTYASYERRLRSFATWPDKMHQRKEDLAAAGFFYFNGLFSPSDQTMCFYCGGCLKDWEPKDDPVEEHIKWFPKCKFIQKVIAERLKKKKEDLCTLCTTERTDHETCITNKTVTTTTTTTTSVC
ncbi:death-associated inhibitor of apoptosis 1 [Monomorium pharaonis]|uniref:death-associated inhibitor of apoptosis 1 n=1 Tax=Monomorium pharaonis TaxID=307658 RepID=UPI00063EEBBF|nr:death-associated inhibitor of apoptosis 1 [Monomorium pharaonis]XP_012525182.1 death-associated inhibitor of apoptosis 1 [Monomorium pharaonis]